MLDIKIPDPPTSPSLINRNGFCGRKAQRFSFFLGSGWARAGASASALWTWIKSQVSRHHCFKRVICPLYFQTKATCSRPSRWRTDDADVTEPHSASALIQSPVVDTGLKTPNNSLTALSLTPELNSARLASVLGRPSVNAISWAQPRNFCWCNRPAELMIRVGNSESDFDLWADELCSLLTRRFSRNWILPTQKVRTHLLRTQSSKVLL